MPLVCRGVRGATTTEANSSEAILSATTELLEVMIASNLIEPNDVASALFTTTTDLNAAYPAKAARRLGWTNVALLCAHEMEVSAGLPGCIRILIHWNTEREADEIVHVYLREAKTLRPDLDQPPLLGQ